MTNAQLLTVLLSGLFALTASIGAQIVAAQSAANRARANHLLDSKRTAFLLALRFVNDVRYGERQKDEDERPYVDLTMELMLLDLMVASRFSDAVDKIWLFPMEQRMDVGGDEFVALQGAVMRSVGTLERGRPLSTYSRESWLRDTGRTAPEPDPARESKEEPS